MKIEIRKIKEEGLIQITTLDERWYKDESDNTFEPSVTWIASYYPKGKGYEKYLAEKGWDEAERIKQEAGDRGTIVHHAIQKGMETGILKMDDLIKDRDGVERQMTPDEYYCAITFNQWWTKEGKPKPLFIEKSLISKKNHYAGTLDYLFENGLLLDVKTSKDVWPSHELQLSALEELCKENGLEVKTRGIIQVGYTRNKSQHYKFTETENKFNLFLSARDFWKNENDGSKPFQRDYPVEITF